MSDEKFNYRIKPWSTVKENKEYTTPIFNLFKRTLRLEAEDDQAEGEFYILNAPEWINVIALTPEKEIILVEQYRFGIEEPTLETPGGVVDTGEKTLEAAKRELLEETGYQSDRWSALGKVSANPAIMSNYAHVYLAEHCIYKGADNPDEHERINVHSLPWQGFMDLVKDGTVHHSIVLTAVARYLSVKG